MSTPSGGEVLARIAAGALALVAMVAVVGLSRFPYEVESGEDARLRLSWRYRATVEECREPSQEELAELPVHMRQEVVCDRRVPPYRLRLRVDGREIADEVIRAAGAQEDRPLYVYREIPLEPGTHRVEVRFHRAAEDGGEAPDEDGAHDALDLETTVTLEPREVALVTYVPGDGRLQLVGGGGGADGGGDAPDGGP